MRGGEKSPIQRENKRLKKRKNAKRRRKKLSRSIRNFFFFKKKRQKKHSRNFAYIKPSVFDFIKKTSSIFYFIFFPHFKQSLFSSKVQIATVKKKRGEKKIVRMSIFHSVARMKVLTNEPVGICSCCGKTSNFMLELNQPPPKCKCGTAWQLDTVPFELCRKDCSQFFYKLKSCGKEERVKHRLVMEGECDGCGEDVVFKMNVILSEKRIWKHMPQ